MTGRPGMWWDVRGAALIHPPIIYGTEILLHYRFLPSRWVTCAGERIWVGDNTQIGWLLLRMSVSTFPETLARLDAAWARRAVFGFSQATSDSKVLVLVGGETPIVVPPGQPVDQ